MNEICSDCGKQKKLVPAGKSKRTGKTYKAFQVCEVCKPYKPKEEAPQGQNSPATSNLQDIEGELIVIKLQNDKILELLENLVPNPSYAQKSQATRDRDLPF